jgi:hypothetical protein
MSTRERLPDIFFLKAKIALAQNLSRPGKFLLRPEALTEPDPTLKRHLRKENERKNQLRNTNQWSYK